MKKRAWVASLVCHVVTVEGRNVRYTLSYPGQRKECVGFPTGIDVYLSHIPKKFLKKKSSWGAKKLGFRAAGFCKGEIGRQRFTIRESLFSKS